MYDFLKKFPFPLIVGVVFVFIGVLTGKWHPTWMLFLLVPAYYSVVAALGHPGDGSTQAALRRFPFPAIVILLYLCLGFFLHLWHPGWLLFLLVPIYYAMIPLFKEKE